MFSFKDKIYTNLFSFENKLKEWWIRDEEGKINRKREIIWKLIKKDIMNGFQRGYTKKIINIKWGKFENEIGFEKEVENIQRAIQRFLLRIFLTAITIYILILVLYQGSGPKGLNISDDVTFQKELRFMVFKETSLTNKQEFMEVLSGAFIALGAGGFGLLGLMMGAVGVAVTLLNKVIEENSLGIEGFARTLEDFSKATRLLIINIILSIFFYLFTYTRIALTIDYDYIFYGIIIFFYHFFTTLTYISKVFTSCFEGLIAGTPMENKLLVYSVQKNELKMTNKLVKRIKKKI